MGMRRNIALNYGGPRRIYLYTHWGAEHLEDTLRDALVRGRSRWADPEYLARIIFSEMIKDEVLDTTGYGLAPHVMDDEFPTIEVDLRNQAVGGQSFEGLVPGRRVPNYSLNGYQPSCTVYHVRSRRYIGTIYLYGAKV